MSICTLLVQAQNSPRQMVNELRKRQFNATVYIKFRVCFTFAKYENDMLSLCEITNVFIDAYLLFQNPFHQLGPFALIKTMLNS